MGEVRPVESKFVTIMGDWVNSYLPDATGNSPNTIKAYREACGLLLDYMYLKRGIAADKIRFDDLSYDVLMEFLEWLKKDKGNSDSSLNVRLAALRSFAKYAQNKDFKAASVFYMNINKIPVRKPKDANPRNAMSEEEIRIIINLPSIKDTYGYRDRTILSFLYSSGCRGQELCDLKVKDITVKDEKASIKLTGKGDKSRVIRISKEPTSLLLKYLKRQSITNQPDRYVFTTQRNCQMTVNCLEKIVEKYYKKAQSSHSDLFRFRVTPHTFRHSTATHMINKGVPIIVISRFLGHENITTTLIYAKLTAETINEALISWDRKFWNEYLDEALEEDTEGLSETERNRRTVFKT